MWQCVSHEDPTDSDLAVTDNEPGELAATIESPESMLIQGERLDLQTA
jgi:hypothetical protein